MPRHISLRDLTLVLYITLASLNPAPALADTPYTEDQQELVNIIYQHASVYGVNPRTMIRVAACESQLGLQPHGDRGRSHGPFQLNDRPTGLLWHFYRVGYTNPYSWNQSSDYYARVLSGEWEDEYVTVRRWTCR